RSQTIDAVCRGGAQHSPAKITPSYVARQPLGIEHTRGAGYALIMRWLAAELPLARAPMHLGTVEALKMAVKSKLGMSIVPDVAVGRREDDLITRPLRPPVPCTLALIEHRNKPNEPALEIVRDAILRLRDAVGSPLLAGPARPGRPRRGPDLHSAGS